MKVGQLGTAKLRLARDLPKQEAYQRRYIPVDPQDERVVASEFALTADDQVKVWRATSWRGGEFDGPWDAERRSYRRSLRVRPTRRGDGLVLGPKLAATQTSGAAAITAGSVGLSGFAGTPTSQYRIGIWDSVNSNLYEWDPADAHADLVDATDIDTLVDEVWKLEGFGTDTWMVAPLAGSSATEIIKYDSSSDAAQDTTVLATKVPWLKWWRDRLFYVDTEDLYEVDDPDANTSAVTQRSAINPVYSVYSSGGVGLGDIEEADRITAGDVGPVWWFRTATLDVEIWQYNVGADTAEQIGTLPVRQAQPTAMLVAFGFVFVAFRARPPTSGSTPDKGEAFVYYQRGSQRGVAGPFRDEHIDLETGHWWHLPNVVGFDGDELLITWAAGLWAYNVTDGAIYHLGLDSDNDRWAYQAAMLGQYVVLANSDDGDRGTAPSTYYNLRKYTTDTAWLDCGPTDFQYPGLDKILLDVTVETDPLPAGTSVQIGVSVDGGAFTTLSGTHDTDNATTHTFTASTNASTLRGKSFEIRVMLATTDEDETPTVRAVSARATGAAHRIEWILEVDASDVEDQNSSALIDSLNALATDGDVAAFKDPWQNPDHETPDEFDVTVEEIITPRWRDQESDAEPRATIRLRSGSLV